MFKTLSIALMTLSLSVPAIISPKSVTEDVSLSSTGDGFQLSEQSFLASDSYVYSSRITFKNEGQAVGLIIGGQQDDHYYVFNIDRKENHTKLLYFSYNEEHQLSAEELYCEDYIYVNDDHDREMIQRVIYRSDYDFVPAFELKVIVTAADATHVYAEFFINNIKRFGIDTNINLLEHGYNGGHIGYQVYAASALFSNISVTASDYVYYSELYRNQYHFSQYANWNNDPNGMVYYKGYYHLYYQTNIISKQWGDMYWGHARSTDLLHWEELPTCLTPDDETKYENRAAGYAWSGCAMVYEKGMSAAIDELNLFPNGNGTGLIGYYTRSGDRQDQVFIYSDTDGLTWTKGGIKVPQEAVCGIGDRFVDVRDPSIFPVTKVDGKVTLWGMVLAGQEPSKGWFMKSSDLLNWSYAGEFKMHRPECLTVSNVEADDGSSHSVITMSSRGYVVGDFSYNSVNGNIVFTDVTGTDISTYDLVPLKTMDYAEDSYAGQVFNNAPNGDVIGMNWYARPNEDQVGLYASVRSTWNGGFTTPVKYGLAKVGTDYVLTQTPVIKQNTSLKTNIVNIDNQPINETTSNLLEDVDTHILEMDVEIDNPNDNGFEIRVNVGDDEYTSIGWNKTEGYFVDRTHTSDAGINFTIPYHARYTSGPTTGKVQTLYILSDNGALEVFVNNFKYSFYVLTLAAPTSQFASFKADGEMTVNKLNVNAIKSVWKNADTTEGVLYLNTTEVNLDLTLLESRQIIAYQTAKQEILWESQDESIVSVVANAKGALVTAHKIGTTVVTAKAKDDIRTVIVTVDNGTIDSNVTFTKEGVISGLWRTTSNGLVGEQPMGDGFILSNETTKDGVFNATFDLTNAAAAGIAFHCADDMSYFLMANYDKYGHVCKIWNSNGHEYANVQVNGINETNVSLTLALEGKNIKLSVNGKDVVSLTLDASEPTTGVFGLNACGGSVLFKSITLASDNYEFVNTDLVIQNASSEHIVNIYNANKNNEIINEGFYKVEGKQITISKEYFYLLDDNTTYRFVIQTTSSTFEVKVNVGVVNRSISFDDIETFVGSDIEVYIGYLTVTSVEIDGEEISASLYSVKNRVLHISNAAFTSNDVIVTINSNYSFSVTFNKVPTGTVTTTKTTVIDISGALIAIGVVIGVLVLGGVPTTVILLKKHKSKYQVWKK